LGVLAYFRMSVSSSKASGLDGQFIAPLLCLASVETSPICAALGTRRKQACMGSAQMRQQTALPMHALRPQNIIQCDDIFMRMAHLADTLCIDARPRAVLRLGLIPSSLARG
jgi:hypothetical protein